MHPTAATPSAGGGLPLAPPQPGSADLGGKEPQVPRSLTLVVGPEVSDWTKREAWGLALVCRDLVCCASDAHPALTADSQHEKGSHSPLRAASQDPPRTGPGHRRARSRRPDGLRGRSGCGRERQQPTGKSTEGAGPAPPHPGAVRPGNSTPSTPRRKPGEHAGGRLQNVCRLWRWEWRWAVPDTHHGCRSRQQPGAGHTQEPAAGWGSGQERREPSPQAGWPMRAAQPHPGPGTGHLLHCEIPPSPMGGCGLSHFARPKTKPGDSKPGN